MTQKTFKGRLALTTITRVAPIVEKNGSILVDIVELLFAGMGRMKSLAQNAAPAALFKKQKQLT
jgi:hypothetical protein